MAKKYLDNNGLAYFWGKVKDELDDKQDSLTAGTNITIQNNVISATGGGGSVDIATTAQVDAIFDTQDTTSVFLLATSSAWENNPYCYVWNDAQQVSYKPWYGEAMTLTSMTYNNYPIYKYAYPTSDYDKCIFTQGGTSQTVDLTAQPGKVYNPTSNSWLDIRTIPLENNKVISIEGLNEYDIRIKDYIDDTITGALGGSY